MIEKNGSPSKKTTYTINGKVFNSIDEMPLEYQELLRNLAKNQTPSECVVESKADNMIMIKRNGIIIEKNVSPSEKTTYTIGNAVYSSINEVPPECQELIRNLENIRTPKECNIELKSITTNGMGVYTSSGMSHKEKFLYDAVFPNLNLMDNETIKIVMKDFEDSPKGLISSLKNHSHIIWLNFVFALWITIAYNLYNFAWCTMHPEAMSAVWGPWDTKATITPLLFALILGMLWFLYYREHDPISRLLAFMTGLMMICLIIVVFLRADLMNWKINWWHIMFYIYFGGSNFLYAVAGKGY